MWRRLKQLGGWAVLVAAIIGIIYPAFFDSRLSLTQILISLADFDNITFAFLMRWLSVIVLCAGIYIFVTNWAYRNLPISVIWTRLNIFFDKTDGSQVRVDREQALRANRPDVGAYFLSCKPTTETGHIPEDRIACSVYCGDLSFQSQIDLHGSERRGFEVMHLFGTSLPFAWYMPLLPIWLLNREPEKLFRWCRKKIAVRHMSITYMNEFNVAKPSLSFISAIYPHHNLSISIHFPPGIEIRNLKARRIKTNGVVDMRWRNQANVHSVYIDRLENETLRITWER